MLDRFIDNDKVWNIISYILGAGFFITTIYLGMEFFFNKKKLIASGDNNIQYTIPLFIILIFLQRYLLAKFYTSEGKEKTLKRNYLRFSLSIGLIFLVVKYIQYFYHFSTNTLTDKWPTYGLFLSKHPTKPVLQMVPMGPYLC